jgi:uncharacterized protein YcbX
MSPCTVTKLTLYPIKSCQGVEVDSIERRKEGIVGDRALLLVHEDKGLSQKNAPALASVEVTPFPRVLYDWLRRGRFPSFTGFAPRVGRSPRS